MNECVVRMEMPNGCDSCGLRFICKAYYDFFSSRKVGMEGCLIICQLPEGHGRLVDINIVAERIKDAEELSEFCDEFEFGGRWTVDLSKIPTIVPASH